MQFKDVAIPETYKQSADFRFFLQWFESALTRIKYDTENIFDLYDPLRCPSHLLWMLGDTIGYRYDDRLPVAFNRLVMLYFMSMIRYKGSKNGLTLAAELNLSQFQILADGKSNGILYDRLENTNVPVNSAYVTPHVKEGYIDVVYFSTNTPVDTCTEYVRPLGMYMFQHAGVRFDARTKVSVDARLTNTNELGMSIGPTHIGHYRRDDYARMQRMSDEVNHVVNSTDVRQPVYYRNATSEGTPNTEINPGYRALYSLQLCNNEHVVQSLIDPIFTLGDPTQVTVTAQPNYIKSANNLYYNLTNEQTVSTSVSTIDTDRTTGELNPRPAVNPVMGIMGEAISMNTQNTQYTDTDADGNLIVTDSPIS